MSHPIIANRISALVNKELLEENKKLKTELARVKGQWDRLMNCFHGEVYGKHDSANVEYIYDVISKEMREMKQEEGKK